MADDQTTRQMRTKIASLVNEVRFERSLRLAMEEKLVPLKQKLKVADQHIKVLTLVEESLREQLELSKRIEGTLREGRERTT